jgi:hypothetical protein
MKRTILYGTIGAIAGCFMIATAFAQKPDEAAIKKVLQQETSTYFHKNYDAWADTWLHDTAASILRAGTNGYEQLLGWNAIAAEYKTDIQGLRSRTEAEIAPFLNKSDYYIYINGNVATVSFKEGDKTPNTERRTLVKQNGAWKILNYTLIDNSSYAMLSTIRSMKRFAGKWELDGKPTMEPSNGGELISLKFELKVTPNGLEQYSNFLYSNNKGQSVDPPADIEYFIPDYNADAVSYMEIEKNPAGLTFPHSGLVTSTQPNSFTVTVMYPDKPTAIESEYTVTMQNGKWHQMGKQYDREGKQTFTTTIDLHRVMQ